MNNRDFGSRGIFLLDKVINEVGLKESVILTEIYFWIKTNEDKEHNFKENKYWTYRTLKSFNKRFPYLKKSTIHDILKKLEKSGYILIANFNKEKFDNTRWYTLTEKSMKLFGHKSPKKSKKITETKKSQKNQKRLATRMVTDFRFSEAGFRISDDNTNKTIPTVYSKIEKSQIAESVNFMCDYLQKIFLDKLNFKYKKIHTNAWRSSFYKLIKDHDETLESIWFVLKWYRDNIGEKNIPWAETGPKFCKIFPRLKRLAIEETRNETNYNAVPLPLSDSRIADGRWKTA